MIRRLSYALAFGLIMALTGAGCIGVQSDPLPGGGYVSYPVIIPRDGQPLGDVTPFPIPTVDTLPTPTPCTLSHARNAPLNVRASVWGTIVGILPANVSVGVLDSATDSAGRTWYRIENPAGWVAGWLAVLACDEIP